MSRKLLYRFLACLLCLLPALTHAQTLAKYEYWFDDNFSGRHGVSLSGTEAVVKKSLSTEGLDYGAHKFSFRVRQSDGKYSAITSSMFLKRPAAQSSTMEYWFDDNFDGRDVVDISNTEEEQSFVFDLRDNTKYPWGFHKLNMRITLEGGGESAVYSSGVLKLSAGTATTMEYWLDDDRENIRTIDGHLASDGQDYLFVSDLDLGDVTPGHHRLYCRVVSNSGKTATAVTMTPIIVKSRYNVSSADVESLTVTEHAYWFDDEEPEVVSVANPKNIINQPYTFDTRKMSDGQHTLHVQYGNSAGIWNGPIDHTFTKTKVNDPLIEANAFEEDGVVTLKFNAVPYGFQYVLVRKYPSGKIRQADVNMSTNYPAALQLTDTPAPGTYSYYIEGSYTDVNGEKQKVRSGEVSVTVSQAASTVKRGRINGVITFDGQRVTNSRFYDFSVYINGENAVKSAFSYFPDPFGQFRIGDVPYGTEITIGVEHEGYHFNDVTLVVSENTTHYAYYFNGTKESDIEPENSSYDLILSDDIHITPSAWEVEVWNKSSRPWSGNISLLVISKKEKDRYDKAMSSEGPSLWDRIFSPNVSYEDAPLYKVAADGHVVIGEKTTKVVTLDITDLPEKDRNEAYYVYAFSQRDGTGLTKKLEGFDVYPNPQVLDFNPFNYDVALEKGFKSYMKGYAEVMKYVNKFSEWGDPFDLEIKSCKKGFELWVEKLEKGEVDDEDLNDDVIDASIKSIGMLLNCFFSDMHKSVKKYSKTIKENQVYEISKGIKTVYETVKNTYNATQVDDNHKFFELAKQVLSASKAYAKTAGFDPVLECYKSYFEVGDAMASAVDRIQNRLSGYYIWDRLSRGNGIYKIKIRRYSETGDFAGYFQGRDFYPTEYFDKHNGQIKSIDIVLVNAANGVSAESMSYTVDIEDDGIVIKNVTFNHTNDFYADNDSGTEAWMKITWNNNRVTHVPLLDKHFVKLENLHKDVSVPLIVNVELQSEAYMNNDGIANKLTFVKP